MLFLQVKSLDTEMNKGLKDIISGFGMKKLPFIILTLFFVAVSAKAQNDTVVFSVSGGFYEDVFSLELYNYYPQNHIRYTTNGNRPTAESKIYESPLLLNENLYSKSDIYTIINCPESNFYLPDSVRHCIVIRAAVFDENDSCISTVKTNSYFIRALGCDTHGLPAVSLCADSLDLFDYYRGIFVPGVHYVWWSPLYSGNYFQRGIEWERLCNVEYYELDNTGINQQAGLRTHGGSTRRIQQKNLKILAKEEYGNKRFKHNFFQEIPIDSFKHLVLKPFCCSNGVTTGIQEALTQRVARSLNIDALAYQLSVLFINGEYWGIYGVEETPDERYIEDHYDFNPEEINIIKNWNVLDEGDSTNWVNLYQWVQETDLSLEENYALMKEKIDVNNFIDYWIFELYSSNCDWPVQNVRCWQRGDGKWRWIFFDGDACFWRDWDVFANAVDTSQSVHPSNAGSTLFFRKLIENNEFINRFSSRFEELMSNRLCYESIIPYFNTLRMNIEAEIPNQCHRFGFPSRMERWERDMANVDTFLFLLNDRMLQRLYNFNEQHHIGVEEKTFSFQCYPNPSSGEMHLRFDADALGATEIGIYDMMGRKVFATSCQLIEGKNEVTINPKLAAGVYLLRVGGHAQRIVRF